MNLFKKFASGMKKTRESLTTNLKRSFTGDVFDEDLAEDLEEILITSDLGVNTSMELSERVRDRLLSEKVDANRVLKALREELGAMVLEAAGGDEQDAKPREKPFVTFVVGVNGTGKTTTIGKLARRYAQAGQSVLVVAADTFRMAAVEQVAIWAERAGVDIVKGTTGQDPGSVVYDGLQAAKKRGVDRVLVDTAGRLHTKQNLMQELGKLDRVAKKIIPDAPHEVLLVVDGTTGQNGLAQARSFGEVMPITALVVTKLDGTAKGGVLVPIGRELQIPVRWVGVGEGIDDLVPFHPKLVVEAVFGDDSSMDLAEKVVEKELERKLDFDLEGGYL